MHFIFNLIIKILKMIHDIKVYGIIYCVVLFYAQKMVVSGNNDNCSSSHHHVLISKLVGIVTMTKVRVHIGIHLQFKKEQCKKKLNKAEEKRQKN